MRSAPSVMYPVGRCALYAGLLITSGCLAFVVVAWSVRMVPPRGVVSGMLLWLTWGAVAVPSWRHSPVGRLQWNGVATSVDDISKGGGAWWWHSAACQNDVLVLRVERIQDLQHWMLLRFHNPDGARTWVWVTRASDPQRWDDLRRALVAHG